MKNETILWGITAQSHDAALAVYRDGEIVYASHSERYSRIKNDKNLHHDQIQEAMKYGSPSRVLYYENHLLKKARQLVSGQFKLLTKETPTRYLKRYGVNAPVKSSTHHHSHAAYAYYTQPNFVEDCDVLVIDSIGEFDTLTIWQPYNGKLKKIYSQKYPHSVGLWYSAMTQRLGLKPLEHEYILMGMAALGDPDKYYQIILDDFFDVLPSRYSPEVRFKHNLHRGCLWWRNDIVKVTDYVNIAAAVQKIYNEIFENILAWMREHSSTSNVAIAGGCALNCVANISAFKFYDNVWVPPNPGDAGSSVGAILSYLKTPVKMKSMFLGTDIPGNYPTDDILYDLKTKKISAVAAGRAEFGPRALGARSLLADPRDPQMKDKVNSIKKREDFRPFAPMILKEELNKYFVVPNSRFEAPYMQYALKSVASYMFPAVTHVDGTSRVQTVDIDHPARPLLEKWYEDTGCPMLLNTSLNVKGEPLVNTIEDSLRWSLNHGIKVRTPK